jgi:hypothetical protein
MATFLNLIKTHSPSIWLRLPNGLENRLIKRFKGRVVSVVKPQTRIALFSTSPFMPGHDEILEVDITEKELSFEFQYTDNNMLVFSSTISVSIKLNTSPTLLMKFVSDPTGSLEAFKKKIENVIWNVSLSKIGTIEIDSDSFATIINEINKNNGLVFDLVRINHITSIVNDMEILQGIQKTNILKNEPLYLLQSNPRICEFLVRFKNNNGNIVLPEEIRGYLNNYIIPNDII